MSNQSLKYWLALRRVDGIGNLGFKKLVDALGTPEAVFRAPLNMLTAIPDVGKKSASGIKSFNDWRTIEKEIELCEKQKVTIITCRDKSYPDLLLHIYDYPTILYVRGTLEHDDVNIAVVGSRQASTYGKYSTEKLCRELAFYGVTVVSGMARGIDAAAHRGAIAGKGRTIAVLGCGLDIIYPSENEKLYNEIPAHGAIITEFPFGTPPNAANFPARNRIISGLSLGVVVVEATDKSGSLITARIAGEQGREVFAVPGSIDSAGSKGTNKLIKEGAKLVETVQDILEEIAPQIKKPDVDTDKDDINRHLNAPGEVDIHNQVIDLSADEIMILKNISSKPLHVNTIIESTGLNAGKVLNVLMQLELKGIITKSPGAIVTKNDHK
jgi:DNA processing protein